MLSKGERLHIGEGIRQGIRTDGRSCSEYRPLKLELGVLPQASGSARCQLGATDVLVGVKAELGTPLPGTPDQGGIQFAVECSPCGSVSYQGRERAALELEYGQALVHSVLAGTSGRGSALDLESLCIVSGKTCWVVCVDGLVLNADGSVVDALSIAVKAALMDVRIPHVEMTEGSAMDEQPELELDDDPAVAATLDTSNVPLLITVAQVLLLQAEGACAVDLTAEEEGAVGQGSLQIGVNARGQVCHVRKRGPGALHLATLQDMIAMAERLGPEIVTSVSAFCKANLQEAMAVDAG